MCEDNGIAFIGPTAGAAPATRGGWHAGSRGRPPPGAQGPFCTPLLQTRCACLRRSTPPASWRSEPRCRSWRAARCCPAARRRWSMPRKWASLCCSRPQVGRPLAARCFLQGIPHPLPAGRLRWLCRKDGQQCWHACCTLEQRRGRRCPVPAGQRAGGPACSLRRLGAYAYLACLPAARRRRRRHRHPHLPQRGRGGEQLRLGLAPGRGRLWRRGRVCGEVRAAGAAHRGPNLWGRQGRHRGVPRARVLHPGGSWGVCWARWGVLPVGGGIWKVEVEFRRACQRMEGQQGWCGHWLLALHPKGIQFRVEPQLPSR